MIITTLWYITGIVLLCINAALFVVNVQQGHYATAVLIGALLAWLAFEVFSWGHT